MKNVSEKLEKDYGFSSKVVISRRARRVTLRLVNITHEIKITLPHKTQYYSLKKFIEQNLGWIRVQLEKRNNRVLVSDGASIPIFGVTRVLSADPELLETFIMTETNLILAAQKEKINLQAKKFLKRQAKEFFEIKCDTFAKELGVFYNKISVKDTKSRWGSCSSNGNLMFSWRLMLAPKVIASYVSAHEVAHLLHLDHSPRFWRTVSSLCPNYKENRYWLKKNGFDLQRFVFE